MNQKRFEYQNKDIPFLKKDALKRILYMFLFLGVFALQLTMFIFNQIENKNTKTTVIVAAFVMLVSFIFALMSFAYAFKDLRLIGVVKNNGFVVSAVSVMPSIEKRSFLRLYSLLTNLLSLLLLLLFISTVTYGVLQFMHFATYSAYLPAILLITILGLNSSYHVKHEIELTKTVKEYQTAF